MGGSVSRLGTLSKRNEQRDAVAPRLLADNSGYVIDNTYVPPQAPQSQSKYALSSMCSSGLRAA
jgi:hypothetical protein